MGTNMDTQQAATSAEDGGSKPRRRVLLCAAIVVILSAIILGSVLGTRDNTRLTTLSHLFVEHTVSSIYALQNRPSSPQYLALAWMSMVDKDRTFLPQIMVTCLSDLFVKYTVSIQALQNRSSPQYEALVWMAYSDSTSLQSKLSDDELVERFALVVLYFAAGGGSWSDQAGFLNPLLDTCSWNGNVGCYDKGCVRTWNGNSPDIRSLGVGCNDEGSVMTLDLCKFPKSST
jgi:hypothetical protein